MEEVSQFPFKLTRKKKKYNKNTRTDITEDVYHNVIEKVEYFRCGLCGKYTAPTLNARCEKCVEQLVLL